MRHSHGAAVARVSPPPKDPPKAKEVVSEKSVKEHTRKIDQREIDKKNEKSKSSTASVSGFMESLFPRDEELSPASSSIPAIDPLKESNKTAFSVERGAVLPSVRSREYEAPPPANDYVDDGRKKKVILREKEISALFVACKALGIPKKEQEEWVWDAIIRADKASRTKWVNRSSRDDVRGNDLWTLSAPNFLRRIHSDYISDNGMVFSDAIKLIDYDLMVAVDDYIRKRKSRQLDLGDAKGLIFILERPRNASPFHQPHRHAAPA